MTNEDRQSQNITSRQAEIVAIVGENGYTTLESLASRFSVSMQSVRRDIIQLDQMRLIQRFHGGAGPSDSTIRLGYQEKRARSAEAKIKIAKRAVQLIPDGATIYLDVGTTVEALAQELRGRQAGIRVFTTSLATGMVLAGEQDLELHVVGGTSRGADGSLAGATTVAMISSIRFDISFIGYSGFDDDGTIMDYDLEKIAVKQAAIRRSDKSIAVGDQSKFEHHAIAQIAAPRSFSKLVSDAQPPSRLAEMFSSSGLEVVIA
ncbi:DeoR/GlpR family DNA-binding transcription regulator (plasmid) [Rhizobium leguminosarum]|nr:DeoR/GlpR family DNA-binding transcription regulator [Rhizobium leguminosarum]UIK14613.1 DeoR/GlpR family DNA-binding transcription regulator [Rhizobium leguminosarum]UIL31532.1 DeoR/GlpR family DNA-binding transcription regulator [Rhizobium leguminosarum]